MGTWIEFEIKTHIRIGSNWSTRKRRSINDLLADAFDADNDVITGLQSTLILPESVTLLKTTETEEELVVIAPGGEEAGSCSPETGCECNPGYIRQDGNCAPPPPALPPVDVE